MPVCATCSEDKEPEEFYFHGPDKKRRRKSCIECFLKDQKRRRDANPDIHRKAANNWAANNPEKRREISRRSATTIYHRNRRRVIHHYGGKCECCSESRYEFLTIDHREGRAGRHKGASTAQVVRFIEEEGYPDDYRVLCWNCNCAIGKYGYCPHDTSS